MIRGLRGWRPTDRSGVVFAAAGAVGWFSIGLVRWINIRSGASDLGIFDQASWLLSRGRAPFISSIGINVFADHLSPVLVIFAPLYRIWATPIWLLGAQAACLGLTVLPMRALAVDLGVPRALPTALVLASPALWSAATYDVHPVVFATPAVAFTLLAATRGNTSWVTIGGVIVALCRADAVVALLGIAVIAAPGVRRRLIALVPIPLILSFAVAHWLGTWQTFGHYYAQLGTGWVDAAIHPWRFVFALVAPSSLLQVVLWLAPVGFLPLVKPRWCLAGAVAGLPLLLSSWPGIPVPWYHHTAFLVPIAVGGAMAGWAHLAGSRAGRAAILRRPQLRWAVGFCLVATLALASPLAPYAPSSVRLTEIVKPPPDSWRAAVSLVGEEEGVASTNQIVGHLSRRNDAFIFPCPFPATHDGHRCGHPQLASKADAVRVVVLPGKVDLRWLSEFGEWRIEFVDGVTVARRI